MLHASLARNTFSFSMLAQVDVVVYKDYGHNQERIKLMFHENLFMRSWIRLTEI